MLAFMMESAMRSCALALVVWLILTVMRVRNPRLHRLAWRTVLIAAIAMPALMRVTSLPVGAGSVSFSWAGIETVEFFAMPRAQGSFWGAVLSELYLLVVSVLACRYAYGLTRLWGVRRRAVPLHLEATRGSDVRATSECGSPVAFGTTILVTQEFSSWDALTQRAVIAHENSHVGNLDFHVQLLAQVHRIVFWFSPLAWWLPSRLTMLSEQLSDDAAIEAIRERESYAEILLGIASRGGAPGSAVAMARPATVMQRVERILAEVQVAARPRWRHVSGLLAAMLPCVLLSAGLTLVSREIAAADQAAKPVQLAAAGSNVTAPRSNPAMPLSQPMYPPISRRLREQGTVVLHLYVLADGSVAASEIASSSGYPFLDDSALYNAYNWRLEPGTIDGQPAAMWGRFAVTFKLSD